MNRTENYSKIKYTPRSYKASSKRTVSDAAKLMPEAFRKPFMRAWRAVGCMDLYGGDPAAYMAVISEQLERARAIETKLRAKMREIQSVLDEALSRNE